MSDISRKALMIALDEIIGSPFDHEKIILLYYQLRDGAFPSTESEGEATQGAYNNLLDPRIVENKRLRAENERLRATLELIKRNEMFEHMTKTSTWRLADEPLSSHREDDKHEMDR